MVQQYEVIKMETMMHAFVNACGLRCEIPI
jgi:hypothetical protein